MRKCLWIYCKQVFESVVMNTVSTNIWEYGYE